MCVFTVMAEIVTCVGSQKCIRFSFSFGDVKYLLTALEGLRLIPVSVSAEGLFTKSD